jgi:hypothetical protein
MESIHAYLHIAAFSEQSDVGGNNPIGRLFRNPIVDTIVEPIKEKKCKLKAKLTGIAV